MEKLGVAPSLPSRLFPAALAKPFVALGLVVMLPALFAAASRVLGFWLVFGEMSKMSVVWACSLVAAFLVPALLALLAWPFCSRKGAVPGWVSILLGIVAIGALYYFTFTADKVFPSSMRVPAWVLGIDWVFLPFICFTPAIFLGLWRLAGFASRLSPPVDFLVSTVCAFIVPLVGYTGIVAFGAFLDNVFRHHADALPKRLAWMLFALALIAVSLVGFLAFFRAILLALRSLRARTADSAVCHYLALALVAFVLPLAGLALNSKIPFPADFQHAVFYAFPFAITAALLIPLDSRFRWLNVLGATLRLILFPVTVYFFIVFLPFLPFALFAILAVGLGFLILSPALLFFFHVSALRDDFAAFVARCGHRRAALCVVLGCLVLPAVFAVHTEIDRARLHALLDFVDRPAPVEYAFQAKSVSQGVRYAVAPSQSAARRILSAARDFKDGSIVPYLDSWYNYRVFDNLLLPDARWCALWNLFTGEDVKPAEKETFSMKRDIGNAFASFFGRGRTVDTTSGRRFGGGYGATPRAAHLKDYSVAPAVTTGNTTTVAVTLNVAANDGAPRPQEYAARLDVPAGVFVTDFELLIDTNWVSGRIIEKKAAEWVYRQIVTERRDPSILRYGDDGRLELRVFPVPAAGTRSVRITFLYPQGLADSIGVVETKSGTATTTRIPFKTPLVRPFLLTGNGVVLAATEAATTNKTDSGIVVFDCSVSNLWNVSAINTFLSATLADDNEGTIITRVSVLAQNYETRLFGLHRNPGAPFNVGDPALSSWLPARGGFNVDRAARAVTALDPDGIQPVIFASTVSNSLNKTAFYSALAARRSLLARSPRLVENPPHGVQNAECHMPNVLSAWALWLRQDADPSLDLRKEILAASRSAHVLTPAAAFIVVENSMQSKMLDVKQCETLHGSDSFDLTEADAGAHSASSTSPEPSLVILVLLLFVTLLLRREIPAQVPRH